MAPGRTSLFRSIAAIALIGAAQTAYATATSYFISFSGGSTLPTTGLLTYDSATSTVANLQVLWNDHVYDLTNSANAPIVGAGCPGTVSSGATGFGLMSKSLCSGLYDRWFGVSSFGASTQFRFSSQTLALPEKLGASISADGPGIPGEFGQSLSAGDWSLGAPFEAPAGTPIILSNGSVIFPGGAFYLQGKGLLPINYLINFSGGSDLPSIGLFNYDKSTSTFSNFYVEWRGILFDLTAAANAPTAGTGCPGTASSAATTFALMTKSLCGGLYDRWFGISSFGASTQFRFSSQTLALPEQLGASISADGPGIAGEFGQSLSAGDWTLTEIVAVPEASTLTSFVLGLVFVCRRFARELIDRAWTGIIGAGRTGRRATACASDPRP